MYESEQHMPQSPWIKINRRKFASLQARIGWNGSGSEQDPYIIDTISGLSSFLKFEKIIDHIIIKNLTISNITLVKCRNIIIQECNIQLLSLNSCQEVVVRENTLQKVQIMYGGNNVVTKNKIPRNSLFHAQEHSMEKLVERIFLLIIAILVFGTFFLFTIPTFLEDTPWVIYIFIGVGCLLIFLYIQMVFKRLRSRKLPSDRFEENFITEERDMLRQYFKDRP